MAWRSVLPLGPRRSAPSASLRCARSGTSASSRGSRAALARPPAAVGAEQLEPPWPRWARGLRLGIEAGMSVLLVLSALPGRCGGPMRPQKRAYLAHGQGNSFLRLLPGKEARFGLRREHRGLHRDGVRVRREVPGVSVKCDVSIRAEPACGRDYRALFPPDDSPARNRLMVSLRNARSAGLRPAPAPCPQSDGIGTKETFGMNCDSNCASPTGK